MTTFAAINFKELKQYETFSSVAQMDESIYEYIDHIRNNVPQSVIDVLLCLGRASLRCVGLSFMKQATIANQTGYSRKTINKALKTLEALGVIDSVQTKTKAGRPSVKVVRILPFCLERLLQGVTPTEANEANNDAALTLMNEFEPFEKESPKQEKNIISDNQSIIEKVSKLSTIINLDGNLKNIVRYLALKVGNKVKNDGLEILSFGAYCEKVLANEIRLFAARKQQDDRKKAKEAAARKKFEDFVWKHYGAKYEDLGSFVQGEAIREYNEMMNPKPQRIPFYNWLEV
jgi:biotin operon repressor